MLECVGKLLAIGDVIALALAISPTGAFTDRDDWWIVTQWKWLMRACADMNPASPVTIDPRWLYGGLLLSILGIALS
jgi:hypothetical protein